MKRVLGLFMVGGLLLGCGDDEAQTTTDVGAEATTTEAPSTPDGGSQAQFGLAPVLNLTVPPCEGGATPSNDTASCFSLGDPVVGPTEIVAAEAVEYERLNCPENELVCFDDGMGGNTIGPPETAWSVSLTMSDDGLAAFNELAEQCYDRTPECPLGQIAIVVDDAVLSAPQIHEPRFESPDIQLAEDLTETEAMALASRFD